MHDVVPARRITWVTAVALLGLGGQLGIAWLDRGIGSLPVYQGQSPPVGVLPAPIYATLLLAAGGGLLVDLSGCVRWLPMRRALWWLAMTMVGIVAFYSAQAVWFGPVRPFAALAAWAAMFLSALTAWRWGGE